MERLRLGPISVKDLYVAAIKIKILVTKYVRRIPSNYTQIFIIYFISDWESYRLKIEIKENWILIRWKPTFTTVKRNGEISRRKTLKIFSLKCML
jgi:hypothetical protein